MFQVGLRPGKSSFFPGTKSREKALGFPGKIHTSKVRLLTYIDRKKQMILSSPVPSMICSNLYMVIIIFAVTMLTHQSM